MYERPYIKSLKARIKEPRKFIQVIFGPRQVGKTTMITQLLSQLSISNLYESADAVSATNTAQQSCIKCENKLSGNFSCEALRLHSVKEPIYEKTIFSYVKPN